MSAEEGPRVAIRRVAIIGCGIGGLAFAACLKGINARVEEVVLYDPFEDLLSYNLGGAVGLSGATAVLASIGCYDLLKSYGIPIHKAEALVPSKTLMKLDFPTLDSIGIGEDKEYFEGQPAVFGLRWSAIRKLLYDYLTKQKDSEETKGETQLNEEHPRIIFKSNKRLESIHENADTGKVTLRFTDRSNEGNFDLVIGADGVKSVAREYVCYPNQSVATAIPFLSNFLGSQSLRNSGIRVMQCVSPPLDKKKLIEEAKLSEEDSDLLLRKADNSLRQWLGNGCNVLTITIGDEDKFHRVLVIIYKQELLGNYETREGKTIDWAPSSEFYADAEKLLKKGGFDHNKDVQVLLRAAAAPGGFLFDIGIRDHILPLRSWSSTSGRILLLGDAAHAMAPFLGQGANQAVQDAYCLSILISKVNREETLMSRRSRQANLIGLLLWIHTQLSYISSWYSGIATFFQQQVMQNYGGMSEVQIMAAKYEGTRKTHAALIVLGSRIMGIADTMGGPIGYTLKCLFFRLLAWTGIAKLLFLAPMKPVVV